jgi:hypothetical protein
MSESPIEQLLAACDKRDADLVMALCAPDIRFRTADGRHAEGTQAVRELLASFLSTLRSTHHRLLTQWHIGEMWIAEVEADYELEDWLQLKALPRAFFLRASAEGIAELRVYGAHERPLTEHDRGEEGTWIGGRPMLPL